MDSRERFYTALKHKEPDRIPHIALFVLIALSAASSWEK